MVGFPKFLNTREDYEYVRANFDKSEWVGKFEALLKTEYEWFNMGKIDSKEAGVEDDTHKVVEEKPQKKENETTDAEEQTVTYYQFEYKIDPNCKMYKLGYTHDEVEKIINE